MPRLRYQLPNGGWPEDETLPLDTLCTILTRQSTLAQKERNTFSAEVDPKDLIREAERLGFPPERIRVLDWDMGKGAYNTTIAERPALKHWLTELLPSGQSRVVLVSQEDRLFRDKWEEQHNAFIRQVATHGGWVVCGTRIYNFRREMDREQFRLACKYGRQYIEFHLKQRLHPAAQRAAMEGRYVGGMVPWGYLVNYDQHSPTFKHYMAYAPHATLVTCHVFQPFTGLLRPSVVEISRRWEHMGLVWPFFGLEVDPRRVRSVEAHCTRDDARGGYRFNFKQAQNILTDVAYLGWRVRAGQVALDAAGQPQVCHEPLVEADLFWWCYDHVARERPAWAPPRRAMVVLPARPRRTHVQPADGVRFLGHGRLRCVRHGKPLTASVIDAAEARFQVRCGAQNTHGAPLADECPVLVPAALDAALCTAFVAQLTLDARDEGELARLAQQRHQPIERTTSLDRELAEQTVRLERAKRLAMQARDEELAAEFLEEARAAKQAIAQLQLQRTEIQQREGPAAAAWAVARRAMALAERIRATFCDWPRHAQAPVIALALEAGVVGRVSRRVSGLWVRWAGGVESRASITSRYGRHVPWTLDEEEALRRHYARLTWDALCAMLPGRTREAIERRAERLQLSRAGATLLAPVPPMVIVTPQVANMMAGYGFGNVGNVDATSAGPGPGPPLATTSAVGCAASPPSAPSSSSSHPPPSLASTSPTTISPSPTAPRSSSAR